MQPTTLPAGPTPAGAARSSIHAPIWCSTIDSTRGAAMTHPQRHNHCPGDDLAQNAIRKLEYMPSFFLKHEDRRPSPLYRPIFGSRSTLDIPVMNPPYVFEKKSRGPNVYKYSEQDQLIFDEPQPSHVLVMRRINAILRSEAAPLPCSDLQPRSVFSGKSAALPASNDASPPQCLTPKSFSTRVAPLPCSDLQPKAVFDGKSAALPANNDASPQCFTPKSSSTRVSSCSTPPFSEPPFSHFDDDSEFAELEDGFHEPQYSASNSDFEASEDEFCELQYSARITVGAMQLLPSPDLVSEISSKEEAKLRIEAASQFQNHEFCELQYSARITGGAIQLLPSPDLVSEISSKGEAKLRIEAASQLENDETRTVTDITTRGLPRIAEDNQHEEKFAEIKFVSLHPVREELNRLREELLSMKAYIAASRAGGTSKGAA